MSVTYDIAQVAASVDEVQVPNMPVDTCAGTSGLASLAWVMKLPPHLRSRYRPDSVESQRVILQAYGQTQVKPAGHIVLPITVGGHTRELPLLVCEHTAHPLLLGLLGMKKLGLIVDTVTDEVLVTETGQRLPLRKRAIQARVSRNIQSSSSCLVVEAEEAVTIPAYSERLVTVRVEGTALRDCDNVDFLGRVERDEDTFDRLGIAAAAGPVPVQKGLAKVMLANFTDADVLLPRATVVSRLDYADIAYVNAVSSARSVKQSSTVPNLTETQLAAHRRTVIEQLKLDETLSDLTVLERKAVELMVHEHILDFYTKHVPPGNTDTVTHDINTGSAPPSRAPLRRMAPHKLDIVRQKIDKMLEEGVIRPSRSPWAAAIVLAPKKQPGEWRFAVDYRRLNDVTTFDAYPMPKADVALDCLRGCDFFSSIDLASGFHQVSVNPSDIEKTAFTTPFGLFEFTKLPFGLKCGPATFQRLMDIVTAGLCWRSCLVYLDDCLVFTRGTLEAHLNDVREVFRRLREHGLKAQPSKCHFARRELVYLGHVVSGKGIRPDLRLVEAIEHFPIPTSVEHVRRFLGLAGYYRMYVEDFATIAEPLTKLLRKKTEYIWGEEQQQAFNTLRQALMKGPVLRHPNFELPFRIKTDWSHVAMGAVLTQVDDKGEEHPVAYLSRRCNERESKYSARRGEAVALWWAIKKWRPFVEGREFVVVSDHLSLRFLRQPQDDVKLQRVVNELEHFQFRVQFKKGKEHIDADAVSRCFSDSLPCTCHKDTTPPNENTDCQRHSSELVDSDPHLFDHILVVQAQPEQELLHHQLNDPELKRWRQHVANPTVSPSPAVPQCCQHMFIDTDGVLKYRDEADIAAGRVRVVVPAALYKRFLWLAHSTMAAGHFGEKRTLELLQKLAFWRGMKSMVSQLCAGCLECQKAKNTKPSKQGFLYVWMREITLPWADIHVDTTGPWNRTKGPQHFQHILTVVCAAVHSVRFLPVRNLTAKVIARELMILFGQESFPCRMTCDRGPVFTSEIVKAMSEEIGMKLAMTVANRAQGNGLVERPHRFLKAAIQIFADPAGIEWARICPLLSLAYRSCVHPALGETPFFLERGRDPRIAQELATCSVPLPAKKSVQAFRAQMRHDLQLALQLARQLDRKTKLRQAQYFNRHRVAASFDVGSLVWLWREPPASNNPDHTRRSRKHVFRNDGPWRVLASFPSTNTYRLRHIHTGVEDTFNVDCLRPVVITELSGDVTSVPPVSEDEELVFDGVFADDEQNHSIEVDPDFTPPRKVSFKEGGSVMPRLNGHG